MDNLKKLKTEEKKIFKEAERIEEAEERIKKEEKQILSAEETILKNFKGKPSFWSTLVDATLTRREAYFLKAVFVGRLVRHKFLFTLIITAAVVLIWRGVWLLADETPILSYAVVSLALGVAILWLVKRYTDVD